MNDKKNATEEKAIQKVDAGENIVPVFAAVEEAFEKFAEISREIASRAYDFFRERGGALGSELDDWFKAERQILRPTPVEITESKDEIFVTAAVPGYTPEQIEVRVKDDRLVICGNAEVSKKTEEADTILREWNSNRFFRQFTLPSDVDAEKVVAKLNNGMLELTLPKAAPQEATKVAVKSA